MSKRHNPSRLALLACVCGIPWAVAHAHIGPSAGENNRYVKLTLYGNRARLLYTVYFGEQPGRQARRRMDANRDGAIDEREASAFASELAATVANDLELSLDGAPIEVRWASADAGLGLATVDAGAFSVDLVQWICYPAPAGSRAHGLSLYDHWHAPQAGESEVRVEESPGVRVARSRIGLDNPVSQLRFKWRENRPPHPLDRDGLHVDIEVDPSVAEVAVAPECAPSPAGDDDARPAAGSDRDGGHTWSTYAGVGGGLLALLVALVVALRAIGRRTGS